MKKRTTFFIMALLCANMSLFAQMSNGLFGNEWINYQQSYFKIKISEDGLYHIPAQYLQQSGVDLSRLTTENVQIFHQGREVALHVASSGTTIDYIEFYAEKNRGEFDADLYATANHHFNPEYSLISDTAAYFLTWTAANNGLRYTNRNTNLSNLPQKESYCWKRSLVLPNNWQAGKEYSVGGEIMSKSTFEYGEGWGSNKTNNQSIEIPFSNVCTAGPAAKASLRLFSDGNIAHDLQVKIGNTLYYNSNFFGNTVATHQFGIAATILNNTAISLDILGASGTNDKHSVSFVALEYPHDFNFEGASSFRFKLEASNSPKFLEISNFANFGNAQNIYLFDLTNKLRILCFFDLTQNKVLVDLPPSVGDRELLLICTNDPTAVKTIGRLEQVNFTDYTNHNADYIIIAHSNMFRDATGRNPVLEYAAHRAASGLNPAVIDVQEIFDQFGYGINMHPQALRNFASFAQSNWDAPKYIFLIGKGRSYRDTRSFNTYDQLIPSFGYPASDNLLFTDSGTLVPNIAVGRLSVLNGDELRTYFDKIKDVESAASGSQNWGKNVVHIGGGASDWENQTFSSSLNNLKTIIESGSYGGKVHSFFKNAEVASDSGAASDLKKTIEDGASIITYLGHAFPSNVDYDINLMPTYDNYRRYPLFLSLSCSNGNVFNEATEMSERFVMSANSGTIAYIGFTQSLALSSAGEFAEGFYTNLSGAGYGKGAAENLRLAIDYMRTYSPVSIYTDIAMTSLLYHGDPAFGLHTAPKPDYKVLAANVRTEPATISSETESFELVIDLQNSGKAIDTLLKVDVYRKLPTGDSVLIYSNEIAAPRNSKTIKILVKTAGQASEGLNRFSIVLDADNQIAELFELNNKFVYNLQILAGKVKPVYPPDFAMLPNTDITLSASTANAFAATTIYTFQIDTTPSFNSSQFFTTDITQAGGLLSWKPFMTYTDSTVYFWRVISENTVPDSAFISSFMYLNGQSGWNQSHPHQFAKNELLGIDQNQGTFQYRSTIQELTLVNAFTPAVLTPAAVAVYHNNNMVEKCRCQNENGVYVQVVNPTDFTAWILSGGSTQYGATNCDAAGRPTTTFLFKTQLQTKQLALENFLRDSIPNGHYVLVYTLNNAGASSWSSSLFALFEGFGANSVRELATAPKPWAFFFQKGNPTYTHNAETIADNANEVITLSGKMSDKWYKGSMKSPLIGQVKGWDFLDVKHSLAQNSFWGQSDIDLYGIDKSGRSSKLITNVSEADTFIAHIDQDKYPYLQLNWNNADSLTKQLPEFKYWRISSELTPELALCPNLYQEGFNQTVALGDSFQLSLMVKNIGQSATDSVLIKYTLLSNGASYYVKMAPFESGDTLRTPLFSLSTEGLEQEQQLLVEINPDNDQPELCHFNNIAIIPFFVQEDSVLTQTSDSMLVSSIDNNADAPTIASNYPNPFSIATRFSFVLDADTDLQRVKIEINDLNGRTLRLIDAAELGNLQFGLNMPSFAWDGTSASGERLPSGIYFYRIIAKNLRGIDKNISTSVKMTIVR